MGGWWMIMVYCSKCGFQNEDSNAEKCSKCGAPLQMSTQESRRSRRRREDECFGLPHGGAIVGILFGIIIILWGTSQLVPGLLPEGFGFWPMIVIVFGILIVVGALYGLSRKR
jgi:hypothetical protein